MSHPAEIVQRVADVLHDSVDRLSDTGGRAWAEEILDAVTAASPALTWHADGRVSIDWPTEPAVGALVVVKADLLRRLVEKINYLNEQNGEIRKQVADRIEEALGYSPLREWVKNRS